MAASLLAAVVPSGFEDRTRHKIAFRLLPFLFILYIVNCVDLTNLGFVGIGMSRDSGFNDRGIQTRSRVLFCQLHGVAVLGALLVER